MARWYQGALLLPDRLVANGLLQVEGRRITGVWDLEQSTPPRCSQSQTQRLERGYIAPGFIDVHVHGGGGSDFMDGDPDAAAVITQTHARFGTTALLATTLTGPEAQILQAVRAAKAAPRRGARVLGFHLEGPFVNERRKGAQDGRHLRLPGIAEIDRWLAAVGTDAKQVTLAPEVDGADTAIRHLAAHGAVVSAGHTDATFAQMEAAAAIGLRHITHLYNAMRPMEHREPGPVGGGLTLPGLTVELIADGVHVHPAALALAVAARGQENVILVTDAMRATGLGDGRYRLGEQMATLRGGAVRLDDGRLAGSVLTMDAAVRNMVRLVGVSLPAAVAMASTNPARMHGWRHKGRLAVGMDADLVLLDEELTVVTTVVEGEEVYTC